MPRSPHDPAQASSRNGKRSDGKDPELVKLGRRVLALRQDAKLTQEALAQAADLHWTYVGQIERGERNPTYKNLLKLAHGLGVNLATMLQVEPQ